MFQDETNQKKRLGIIS